MSIDYDAIMDKDYDEIQRLREQVSTLTERAEGAALAEGEIERLRGLLKQEEEFCEQNAVLVLEARADNERLRGIITQIIGLCAQEGNDGEPWNTIQSIAMGEHDTRSDVKPRAMHRAAWMCGCGIGQPVWVDDCGHCGDKRPTWVTADKST